MTYPLANDENCLPLDVPATAMGWLVRRHGGGKGRPGSLYDADGRPLVVPLTATVADLRALGCGPGGYRLDAVDDGRKPLGVTAYTEVRDGEDGEADDGTGKQTDSTTALLSSLTRAFEGMFRVQAERERNYAERERAQTERERILCENIVQLATRSAMPAAAPSPTERVRNAFDDHRDIRELLREQLEDERERDRQAERGIRRKQPRVQSAEASADDGVPPWLDMVAPFVGMAAVKMGEHVGMSPEQMSAALGLGNQLSTHIQSAAAAPSPNETDDEDDGEEEEDDEDDGDDGDEDEEDDEGEDEDQGVDGDTSPGAKSADDAVAEIAEAAGIVDTATKSRLRAMWRLLTPDERAFALDHLRSLPKQALGSQLRQMQAVAPQTAVQMFRVAFGSRVKAHAAATKAER